MDRGKLWQKELYLGTCFRNREEIEKLVNILRNRYNLVCRIRCKSFEYKESRVAQFKQPLIQLPSEGSVIYEIIISRISISSLFDAIYPHLSILPDFEKKINY